MKAKTSVSIPASPALMERLWADIKTFLSALKLGLYSVPVSTPYGKDVLQLDRRHLGQPLPFVVVRERIAHEPHRWRHDP